LRCGKQPSIAVNNPATPWNKIPCDKQPYIATDNLNLSRITLCRRKQPCIAVKKVPLPQTTLRRGKQPYLAVENLALPRMAQTTTPASASAQPKELLHLPFQQLAQPERILGQINPPVKPPKSVRHTLFALLTSAQHHLL
jgi:hypothetical protein